VTLAPSPVAVTPRSAEGCVVATAAEVAASVPQLELDGLTLRFRTRSGDVHALENVTFSVRRGEIVGVVGESGSGKSVLSLALMGLLDTAAHIDSGRATFRLADGSTRDLLRPGRREARPPLAMIFQSPRTALNPIRKVGQQLADVLRSRESGLGAKAAHERARELIGRVKITDPERRLAAYPFEMSGGMCQRVMIALALACRPELLIADEPTTGLDVTTQAAIMDLVRELSHASGMSTILITHDLNLAAESCDRIVVMHAGHVVEVGPTAAILGRPRHPYTAKLIATTPRARSTLAELQAIPGNLPDLRAQELPPCRFSGRCDRLLPACHEPPVVALACVPGTGGGGAASEARGAHLVACRNPVP